MPKILKLFFSFAIIFSLSGCFGNSDNSNSEKNLTFNDPHFTINYPENWIVKTRQNFGEEIPKETVATFSRPEPREGYRTTISIINDIVPPQTSSLDYAKANINNAVQGILEFEKIEERNLEISGEETKLMVFKGKSELNAKTLQYVQTYLVKGELGYTITASDLLDIEENDFTILQDLVKSFTLKNEK